MNLNDYCSNNQLMQFIKFCMVGMSNAIVSYVTYTAFLILFENLNLFPECDYLVSQYIAFFLSVLWSFYWNNKYVFERTEKWYYSLIKMMIVYSITGIILSSILLYLLIDVMGIHKLIAPIINIAICLPVNYLLNKKLAFR